MALGEFSPGLRPQSLSPDGPVGGAGTTAETLSIFAEFDLNKDARFQQARSSKSVFIPVPEQWQKPEGERRLVGTTMVVTGGSDGIGLALVMLGVGEGATVVTNYAGDRSAGVAEELTEGAEAFGGRLIIPQVDLATLEGLAIFHRNVVDAVRTDGPISFFSPSAATGAGGQTAEYARALNYDAPLMQIGGFLPLMMDGATITYPQSEPGAHLDDPNYPEFGTEAMKADKIGERYVNVAGPKYDLQQRLLEMTRSDQAIKEKNVAVRVVEANAVVGTKLWRALQMVSLRERSEKRVKDLRQRLPDPTGRFPTHLDMAGAMLNTAFDGQPSGTITYVGLRPPQTA